MAPRTREELLSLGVMDPALAAELARTPFDHAPTFGADNVAAQRAHRAATHEAKRHLRYLPGPIPDAVREEDVLVRMRDGAEIAVRVYRPVEEEGQGGERGEAGEAGEAGEEGEAGEKGEKGEKEKQKVKGRHPLIVMFHEGGWSMGGLDDEDVNCRLFCRDLGAVCVNVGYRLAPEHAFPTWINDAWDALQWASDHADELGADPSAGFVVGGGSAGGNIAAVIAHMARDEGLSPPLTGQYLAVPAILAVTHPRLIPAQYRPEYLSHPSVTPCRDPILTYPDPKHCNEGLMARLRADPDDPRMLPFHYGRRDGGTGHAGLPPAYLQICGLDPLRDEGLLYERVLREENAVPTRLDVYPGLGHYFWTNWPTLEASRRFVEDTVRGMRWLLEQSP